MSAPRVTPIDPGEAAALIEGELTAALVTFSGSEKAYISEIAGGPAIFIKMAGCYCFEAHRTGLEGEALRDYVAENFSQQAAPHLTYQWNHSSESERITLLTLLALTHGKKERPTQDQLLKAYSRSGYILPDLIKRGLVVEQDGRPDIFSPLFAEWILAEMSVGAGEEADEQTAQEWLEKRRFDIPTRRDRICMYIHLGHRSPPVRAMEPNSF